MPARKVVSIRPYGEDKSKVIPFVAMTDTFQLSVTNASRPADARLRQRCLMDEMGIDVRKGGTALIEVLQSLTVHEQ